MEPTRLSLKKMSFLSWGSLVVILFMVITAYAGEDEFWYSKARTAARQGQKDFAFMQYRGILIRYPGSKYTQEAMFANGEYYFFANQNTESYGFFEKYLESSSEPDKDIFVLAYLLRLAKMKKDEALSEDMKNRIISLHRQSFIFEKSKEYQFSSPLNRQHKVVYDIEKIVFTIEGDPFETVFY